jgi:hypothetical protein
VHVHGAWRSAAGAHDPDVTAAIRVGQPSGVGLSHRSVHPAAGRRAVGQIIQPGLEFSRARLVAECRKLTPSPNAVSRRRLRV